MCLDESVVSGLTILFLPVLDHSEVPELRKKSIPERESSSKSNIGTGPRRQSTTSERATISSTRQEYQASGDEQHPTYPELETYQPVQYDGTYGAGTGQGDNAAPTSHGYQDIAVTTAAVNSQKQGLFLDS